MNHTLVVDENDAQLRWLNVYHPVTLRDAVYVTGILEGLLLHERAVASGNTNPPQRTVGLHLGWTDLTEDQAIVEFCDYLRQTNELYALSLSCLPLPHYSHLLQALHNNTSVKELYIIHNKHDEEIDFGQSIEQLLQHNTDFRVLSFENVFNYFIPFMVPFFRGGYPHLQRLKLHDCFVSHDELDAIIEAMVEGSNRHGNSLKELDFVCNGLTPRALQSFCLLTPKSFPHLQKLLLYANPDLLDDEDITQRFVQTFMGTSPDTCLQELDISNSSHSKAVGYTIVIKALETNRTLVRLEMAVADDEDSPEENLLVQEPIRNQLVASLPKIKGLEHLVIANELLDEYEQDQELMMAFRQNTSLIKLSKYFCDRGDEPVTRPFFLDILKRNNDLAHIDCALGRTKSTAAGNSANATSTNITTTTSTTTSITTTTPTTTIITRSLWPRVLAKVGQGNEGGSPVFKILQARLASWPESNKLTIPNSSVVGKKRKRKD